MPGPTKPVPLAARQLRKQFLEATRQATLGGASMLEDLGRLAHECAEASPHPERSVAFVLAEPFASLASSLGGRPVPKSEADQVVGAFHQTALEAIEALNGTRVLEDPLALIGQLVDLELDLVR